VQDRARGRLLNRVHQGQQAIAGSLCFADNLDLLLARSFKRFALQEWGCTPNHSRRSKSISRAQSRDQRQYFAGEKPDARTHPLQKARADALDSVERLKELFEAKPAR